jgi:hypothetical protein
MSDQGSLSDEEERTGGKKRSAISPLQSQQKDQRMANSPKSHQGSANGSTSGQTRPPTSRRTSFSRPTTTIPVPEDGHSITIEGANRNTFTVDIWRRNGQEFRETVPRSEAFKHIFVKALSFPPSEFAGVIPGFRGNSSILFKTKTIFNIDQKFGDKTNFTYSKTVQTEKGEVTNVYECSIRGVRAEAGPTRSRYTWVKIEGTDYQFESATLTKWLSKFGSIESELGEEVEDLEISSEEEEEYGRVQMATGIYSVKMVLQNQIPQFLPIDGKRVRIYYKGIDKLCQNCYEKGHTKKTCKNDWKNWMEYVDMFAMKYDFGDEFLGRWTRKLEQWRTENPEKHEYNWNEKARTEMETEERREQARQIVELSKAQDQETRTRRESNNPMGPRPENKKSEESRAEHQNQENETTKENQISQDSDNERSQENPEMEEAIDGLSIDQLNKLVEKKKKGRPTNAEIASRPRNTETDAKSNRGIRRAATGSTRKTGKTTDQI